MCISISVYALLPLPEIREYFAWSHHERVPANSGCYVLTTFTGDVVYVGLATKSIRDRMGIHLQTPEKRAVGPLGAAYWFHYLLCDPNRVAYVEQGWMNQTILKTGSRPVLNKVDSPI